MSAQSQRPVGVFDSGVGGLTILRELLRELPDERFVYFGDTGNCPYGVRPVGEIQRLSLAAARFLIGRGAKIIVVACNTASVSALAELREAIPEVPFVGVVPAVKPAATLTRSGKIGVAATEASATGDYLRGLIETFASGAQVLAQGCPRLVTMVEAGTLDGPVAEEAVRADIQPMLDAGIDILVLGCTHFPALRPIFERIAGPGVSVIDSGAAIALQTRRVLTRDAMLANPDGSPAEVARTPRPGDEFWCSGDVARFDAITGLLLGSSIHASATPADYAPLARATA